jgi:preprotein translocase subunit Sec61beta
VIVAVGLYCPEYSHDRSEQEIMKVKLDTMSLISAAIAVAIWVLVIWTAIAAIVAHI